MGYGRMHARSAVLIHFEIKILGFVALKSGSGINTTVH